MRPQPSSDIAALLRGVPLFAGLSDSTLALVARVCHRRAIPKAKYIFCQDDPADAAYIVSSGAVSIILCTADGRELVINEMRPGDCFGELALLTGGLRTASAIARDHCELLVIPRDEFLNQVQAQPRFMQHLLTTMAERLRASSERESALAFLDMPARLVRVLLELDREASEDGFVTISQEELAQRIGATRQTTAKILGGWRRMGWIITGRGKIVVLNRAALKKTAEGV